MLKLPKHYTFIKNFELHLYKCCKFMVTSSNYLIDKFEQLIKRVQFFISNDIIYFLIVIGTFGLYVTVLK